MKTPLYLVILLCLNIPIQASVDLVTLPRREGTQLTIYNSVDMTMVREHRVLTIKEGLNRIQFSWSNTLIDPTSIEFRLLNQQDQIQLTETTFPRGRNDALQWNIESQINTKVPVEIRYFTSGISWKAHYVGLTHPNGQSLNLKGYVRIINHSGEEYEQAEIRLVIGQLNLVEKIADLAKRPAPRFRYSNANKDDRAVMRKAFKSKAASFKKGSIMRFGGRQARSVTGISTKPKDIEKKGLSEYFIFTIEGRETIKINEPKQLVSLNVKSVPLETIYKVSDRRDGVTFLKYYRFKNTKLETPDLPAMQNLGLSPLPNGQIRLYSIDSKNNLSFAGITKTKYIGIGDRVEVQVGQSQDITIQKKLIYKHTENIIARQYKSTYKLYDLVDYDDSYAYEEEIVSGISQNAKVEVERYFDGNVLLWSEGMEPKGWSSNKKGLYADLRQVPGKVEKIDQQHLKYFIDLKPGERIKISYKITDKKRKVGPELNIIRI